MFRALAWLATDIRDATRQLVVDVAVVRRRQPEILTHLTRLERLIMTTADNLVARLNAATDELASDLQSVRDALADAVAGQDDAVRTAVEAELAKLDAPIARLEALGQDPADPVPSDAATPAEPGADEPVA